MYVQVDPAGQVRLHPPPSQLYHSSHLLHQRLVLPPPDLVLFLSHKEEEEGFTQGEEGRQVFHRQLRLEMKQRHVILLTVQHKIKVCRWFIQIQHKAQFLLNI